VDRPPYTRRKIIRQAPLLAARALLLFLILLASGCGLVPGRDRNTQSLELRFCALLTEESELKLALL
jgi:hypothetical protein